VPVLSPNFQKTNTKNQGGRMRSIVTRKRGGGFELLRAFRIPVVNVRLLRLIDCRSTSHQVHTLEDLRELLRRQRVGTTMTNAQINATVSRAKRLRVLPDANAVVQRIRQVQLNERTRCCQSRDACAGCHLFLASLGGIGRAIQQHQRWVDDGVLTADQAAAALQAAVRRGLIK
jgi:hypothetical protein